MLSQDTLVLLGLARCPPPGKLRKQLYLPLEGESPAILCLNPVRQLVINRQTERDVLKNVVEQIIKLASGKSLPLLPTLDDNEVITP
jgi:hypothetical protein